MTTPWCGEAATSSARSWSGDAVRADPHHDVAVASFRRCVCPQGGEKFVELKSGQSVITIAP